MKGKEYVRPISSTWWLQRPSWKRFMLREVTAVFVGAYAVLLLVMVYCARDEQAFAAFSEWLHNPVSLLFHLVTLAMVLYHACTWFQLTPQAMPLWRGEERVNAQMVITSQYLVWAVVSVVIAGLAIGLGEIAMARSNQPIAWSLFGAGGVVAALVLPVMIVLTGIGVPAGWISATGLSSLVHNPLTRLFLFVVISLSLFHAAHRTRFVLMDLGLKSVGGLVAAICYAFAIVGTLLAVVFLIQL